MLQTAKFRDVFLTSKHLPRITVHSWPVSTIKFSETWQFTLVYAWMDGYIATVHNKTLWVLDPQTLSVAGILCLEHKITGISPSGEDLYLLCGGLASPLIKLSFRPRVSDTSILNPEAMAMLLSDHLGSSSREGAAETGSESGTVALEPSFHGKQDTTGQAEAGEKEVVEVTETGADEKTAVVEPATDGNSEADGKIGSHEPVGDEDTTTISSCNSEAQSGILFVEPNPHAVEPTNLDSTMPSEQPISSRVKAEFKDMKVLLMPALGKLSGLLPHHRQPKAPKESEVTLELPQQVAGDGSEGKEEGKDKEEEEGGGPSDEPRSETVTPVDQREQPGKPKDLHAVFGKLKSLRQGTATAGVGAEDLPSSHTASPKIVRHSETDVAGSVLVGGPSVVSQLDSQEKERLLRMAHASKSRDDDVVVGGKGHGAHKKKKKRRVKKSAVSSRCSEHKGGRVL